MRISRAAICLLAPLGLLCLFSPAARANSVWDAVEAGHLTWTGSGISTNWVNGDLVIKFTDTAAESTLHLPGFARVWALAVGGGGAGGDYGGSNMAKAGAGGGGGAGGFVETNNLLVAGGDYSITVGAGGAQRATPATSSTKSNSGSPSSIEGVMTAAGGGGGGFKSNGANGGCGGGGGPSSATSARLGGKAEPIGQGFDGGQGVAAVQVGAGGGGAGGEGEPTSSGKPGNGGLAKSSMITGDEVWYAGGGGGGFALGAGGLGGGIAETSKKGGGGDGGNGSTSTLPANGVDGLGGGGGGAGHKAVGAKGGDGVVIVRISFVVDGPIEKPKSITAPYTGNEIVAGQSIPGVYEVTGEYAATDVKTAPYTYTATLADGLCWEGNPADTAPVSVDWWIVPGTNNIPTPAFTEVVYNGENHVAAALPPEPKFKFVEGSVTAATNANLNGQEYSYTAELLDKTNWRWSDGSTTNQTFTWKILPGTVQMPTPLFESVVYDGENHVVTTNSTLFDFAAGSVTNATNAGFYNYTVSLHDGHNWRWADGSDTNLVYSWSIARLPIARPPIPGDDGVFVYDGHEKIAATNSIYYTFTGSIHGTDVANYSFTAQLNNNWCWNDGDDPLADYTVDWRIEQASNEITYLKLDSWKLGTPAKSPVCQALFGQATAIFSYCAATGGEWSAEKPTTNGVFLVKAVIPETTNYGAAEKTARFLVYKSFEDLYSDWVEITFPNYQGDALYDYPVLIAISEQAYPGFSYARAGDKDSIAFMDFTPDLQQQPLSFEVDTWNPGGTSLIWVKIPRLFSKEGYAKTTIRMYWHLKEGAEAPGPDPADVWLGYSGVWHFGEAANADNAATVRAADSTGNRNEGIPETGSKGNITQMISVDGQIGISRQISSFGVASAGNRLVVSNFANVALGPGFIFSGWVRFGSYTGAPAIFSRKLRGKEGGFEMASDSTNRQKLDLYGRGESGKATGNIGGAAIAGHWEFITWAVSGDKYWLHVRSPTNGSYDEDGTLLSPIGEDLEVLAFGADPTGAVASVYGSVDEFRIRRWGPDDPVKSGGLAGDLAPLQKN